jgi:pSer/pThr/pTyr-binding forkhead associated (FHA) protein
VADANRALWWSLIFPPYQNTYSMTTAVASPPSFQSLPRLGWNNSASPSGLNSMSADDVSRMFMPQRKTVPRTNSSSSVSSTSSTSSTATTVQSSQNSSAVTNGDSASYAAKKKPRGGFWPTTKQDTPANGINGRTQNSSTASTTGGSTASPVAPSQPPTQVQQNGVRTAAGQASNEPTAVLALLPMNGTFERKQINVPFFPDVLRIGRQTNAKTVPTPSNGFFDSKVLSRQHAEIWAERNGKIWIRDVKSSNGTFVNGHRLSPENRDSEPQELHQQDTLELGIDIVSEDQKVIVHHKVSAKVEYVGIPGSSNNVLDLNFGDLDPSQNGSLLSSPISQPMVATRGRGGGSSLVNGRLSATSSIAGSQMNSLAQHRQMNFWSMPLNVEHLVKTLSVSLPDTISLDQS